ncbi:MAG: hypothetical protein WCT43_04710 [Candidatus Magasanikbacteria bacterium]
MQIGVPSAKKKDDTRKDKRVVSRRVHRFCNTGHSKVLKPNRGVIEDDRATENQEQHRDVPKTFFPKENVHDREDRNDTKTGGDCPGSPSEFIISEISVRPGE